MGLAMPLNPMKWAVLHYRLLQLNKCWEITTAINRLYYLLKTPANRRCRMNKVGHLGLITYHFVDIFQEHFTVRFNSLTLVHAIDILAMNIFSAFTNSFIHIFNSCLFKIPQLKWLNSSLECSTLIGQSLHSAVIFSLLIVTIVNDNNTVYYTLIWEPH